jgi:protein-S-isoprenylcysteine O-methyltransferase Ste14
VVATLADNPGVIVRPPLLYGVALIVVFVLRWFWPVPIVDHTVVVWLGLVLVVFGVGIAIWGRGAMQAAGTNVDPCRPTTAIVNSGPFRFSRNPLYMALMLMFFGLSLALNTWWGIVVLVPLVIVMHYGVVLREERYLNQKFGVSYQQYRSKVRRYI